VPFRKIYRAFPELDRFTDDECERYVRYVRIDRGWGYRVAEIGVIAAVLLCTGVAARVVFHRSVYLAIDEASIAPTVLAATAAIGAMFAAVAAAIVLFRDLSLRSAIRARLDHARCPACRYSLLGLRADHDRVVCPECAFAVVLSRHQLTEQDIVAGRA